MSQKENRMSITYPLSELDDEIKNFVKSTCIVKPKSNQFTPNPQSVECFRVNENSVSLPLLLWKDLFTEFPNKKTKSIDIEFKAKLFTIETDPKHYRDQDVVTTQILSHLKTHHGAFIAASTGFGKTTCGAYLISKLKLKTLILCYFSTVNEQWVTALPDLTTAKVQFVEDKFLDPDFDIYVIGVLKASTMDPFVFKDIGIVIFDEAHTTAVTAFTKDPS